MNNFITEGFKIVQSNLHLKPKFSKLIELAPNISLSRRAKAPYNYFKLMVPSTVWMRLAALTSRKINRKVASGK